MSRAVVASICALAPLLMSCGGGGGNEDADAGDTQDLDLIDTGDGTGDADAGDTDAAEGDAAEMGCTADGDCDDEDPCTLDTCDTDFGTCVNDPVDGDGDGYYAASVGAADCGGTDCDDSDDSVFPEADEIACDLVDSDCDDSNAEYIDDDGDLWIDENCTGTIVAPVAGYDGIGDCDDLDEGVYPGAPEGCDGSVDNDCDGDATEVDADSDGDGHSPASCDGDDCDDSDAAVYPGAPEICDDVDNDCDSNVLDAAGADDDGDTVLDEGCGGTDCDDTSAATRPGATELCDTIDQDCDGSWADGGADDDADTVLDDGCAGGTDCDDLDEDVYPGAPESTCDTVDNDCDGDALDGVADTDDDDYLDAACPDGVDCDDLDPTVYPGAPEAGCDTMDNDCDGDAIDGIADDDDDDVLDGNASDGDGCSLGTDCDDTTATVRPGMPEAGCDAIDNDCDGDAIDGIADDDGDDYVDSACPGGNDCNDSSSSVHPGAAEICDLADQDCDGSILDAVGIDGDGDGVPAIACGGLDCDDGDAGVHGAFVPGAGIADPAAATASEVCDLVDNDCDGSWADGGADDDGDGYLDSACGGDDCADLLAESYPGATGPYCHGSDTNCDGASDLWPRIPEIQLTSNGSAQSASWVVKAGSEFGLCWQDNRWGNNEVYFARLSQAGAMIGSEVRISNATDSSNSPVVTWTGTEYGIAWSDRRSGDTDIYFARVSQAGAKIGSESQITAVTTGSAQPSIAWTGSEFGLAWEDVRDGNGEIYFARVSTTGAKVGTETRITNDSSSSSGASLSWSGTEFGLAWEDLRGLGAYRVYFVRISATGTKVGTDFGLTTSIPARSWHPSIAWAGSQYGLAWNDERDSDEGIYFARLSPAGARFGTDVRISATTGADYPAIFWTGSEFGLAWNDYVGPSNHDVYVARIAGSGAKLGTDVRIDADPATSYWPSIAWSGSEFCVTWEDDRSGNLDLYLGFASFCM